MSYYMNRLFPKSNSSFPLCCGNALQSSFSRLGEGTFLVDSGIGTPRICKEDKLTGLPNNRPFRFEDKVGFMGQTASEIPIRKHFLERFFIDLVAGEPRLKEQAVTRFTDMVGSADVVPGEPHLLLPRKFRQHRAWMELKKRTFTKVNGFILQKRRTHYLVAIAGFIGILPLRSLKSLRSQSMSNDQFTIESINPKTKRIVVSRANKGFKSWIN